MNTEQKPPSKGSALWSTVSTPKSASTPVSVPSSTRLSTTGPITSPSTTKDCGSERTLIAAAHHHF